MRGSITFAVEGITDAAVARRLLDEAGLRAGAEYVGNGKSALDQNLSGYNNAARLSRWLVLRDLDEDAACPPELLQRLLPSPAPHMRLHFPVRSIEAWLIADAKTISQFLAVPETRVPADPDALPHPKRALVEVARRSRKRAVREAFVPAPGTSAKIGPGYAASLIEFATAHWQPAEAAKRSQSLARLRKFLRRWSPQVEER